MNIADKNRVFSEIEQNREEYKKFLEEVGKVEKLYHDSFMKEDECDTKKYYEELKGLYDRKAMLDKRWKELHETLDNQIRE